jgi:hypothetical protein
MERPLKEHIAFLERRLTRLNNKMMENSFTARQRNRIEAEIRAAALAITYYRKAIEIERRIR